MNEICGDNRFEIIAKAKAHLLDATNIDTSEDEMKVLDTFLFRCWQMGWLDRYDEQTEPQTERIKTLDYCDICNHKGCDNCIANNLDDYCVPSGYAPKDTPQTDCDTCRHYKLACELFSEVCKYEPTTQTETQNSNLTFEKDECAKEYEELGLKELKELINADRKTENSSEKPNNCDTCRNKGFEGCEQPCLGCGCCGLYQPKDEPQTYITENRDTQILDAWQVHHRASTTAIENEPQTDCSWK